MEMIYQIHGSSAKAGGQAVAQFAPQIPRPHGSITGATHAKAGVKTELEMRTGQREQNSFLRHKAQTLVHPIFKVTKESSELYDHMF